MPVDPRKRQKKQARLAAKRKSKHHELVREKHAGLPERLTAAARYPVLHSWATTDVWTEGMGWVCLSRELPNGFVAFAVFLIDRYCLGVKNALAEVKGRPTYDSQIVRKMRSEYTAKELSPACTRKLVEAAVDYARALGLPPHPDYHKAKLIFGDIDPGECTEEFEFGKDGQPLFIAGPHDNPDRCRQILRILEQSRGPDGFHYMIPFAGSSGALPESLKQRAPRVIGPDEAGTIRDYHVDITEGEDEEDDLD